MNPDQRSFTHELRDGIFGSSTYQWEISIKLTDLYLKEQRHSMLEQLEKQALLCLIMMDVNMLITMHQQLCKYVPNRVT